MSTIPAVVLVFVLIVSTTSWGNLITSADGEEHREDYVKDACQVARYKEICIRSLKPFSSTAKGSTRKWAEVAVSVTMTEAKSLSHYLTKLKKSKSSSLRRRSQRLVILDCIECFSETIDNIQNSLRELRKLNATTFGSQMGDIETWMSAALTYEDTCMEGFEGRNQGKQVRMLYKKILKVSYLTSNALALVNKLASTADESKL